MFQLLFVILCSFNLFSFILVQAIFCYWVTSNLFSLMYGLGKAFWIFHLQYYLVFSLLTTSIGRKLVLLSWNAYCLGHWFHHAIAIQIAFRQECIMRVTQKSMLPTSWCSCELRSAWLSFHDDPKPFKIKLQSYAPSFSGWYNVLNVSMKLNALANYSRPDWLLLLAPSIENLLALLITL